MKRFLFSVLILACILSNVYSTDNLENDTERLRYFKVFFSNTQLLSHFFVLANDNFIWQHDNIVFGSKNTDGSFNGQAQFYFKKQDIDRIIILNFIETEDNIIIITDIHFCDAC